MGNAEVRVVGEHVFLYYVDRLGKLHSTRLACCTATGVVEWRKPNLNIAVPIGAVEEDDQGHRYLKIPLSD